MKQVVREHHSSRKATRVSSLSDSSTMCAVMDNYIHRARQNVNIRINNAGSPRIKIHLGLNNVEIDMHICWLEHWY